MNWMHAFLTANLIGIGSNLDNSSIGIAYGSKNVRFPHWVNVVSNVIGGGTALIGAYAGDTISRYLTPHEAEWAACVVLVTIGLFFWYSGYIHPLLSKGKSHISIKQPGWREGVFLGFALSFTNLASGFGATVAHASTISATVVSITVWGFILIWLGNVLSLGFIARVLGKYASLISGCLLVLVGIHQVI